MRRACAYSRRLPRCLYSPSFRQRLFENSRKGLDRVSLAAKNSEKAVPVARFCRFVKPRLESIRNYQTVSEGGFSETGLLVL